MTRTIPQKATHADFVLPPFSRHLTTTSPEARKWTEHGFIWSYGFNHAESARCFEKALAIDPRCPLAHWGLAFALGPNYNKPWNHFDRDDLKKTIARCHKVLAEGLLLPAEPVERALIEALLHRFPKDGGSKFNYRSWNRDYADAMKPVYEAFGDDLDVAVLYADALMNLTPWGLWDVRTGKPGPGSRAPETQRILERALKSPGGEAHVGLLHMYIHLTEMSGEPERGLPAAEKLRGLGGEVGHLAHMPSHLDILVGDYRGAIAANAAAVSADEKFVRLRGATDFYTIYRMHDYHSLVYAAMFAGRFGVALDAVERMEAALPEEQLRVKSPPMADWLETFRSVRPHVLIRFGRWKDIVDLALPEDQELYCVTTATIHYAKGVAWAATGDVENAERERELFLAAKKRVPPRASTTPTSAPTSSPWPKPCSTANSSTAGATSSSPFRTCAPPSPATTLLFMPSRGRGCSRRDTPTRRC